MPHFVPTDGYRSVPYYHHPEKLCKGCKTKPARLSQKTRWGTYCPACASLQRRQYHKGNNGVFKKRMCRTIVDKSEEDKWHENYRVAIQKARIAYEESIIRKHGYKPQNINCEKADKILKESM